MDKTAQPAGTTSRRPTRPRRKTTTPASPRTSGRDRAPATGPSHDRRPQSIPGLGAAFRRRGFADVRELDWWGSTQLPATSGHAAVTVELVPAHHWSRRSLWDLNASLWGGFVIHGAGRKVYFSGDTAYGPAFRE